MQKPCNVSTTFSKPQWETTIPRALSFHCFPLRAVRFGVRGSPARWAIEHHPANAGKVTIHGQSEEKTIDREKDTVHLYAKGASYSEDNRGAELPIQETYMIFEGAGELGLSELVCPDLKFARFFDPDHVAGGLFSKAAECCAALGEDAFLMVQGVLSELAFLVNRAKRVSGHDFIIDPKNPRGVSSFSHEVEKYMRKRLGEDIKISDIARHMNISESLLSHKFKEEAGTSPVARLIELRIDFAKNLMLKGERLKSIAETAGFCDEYHLSKMFKAQTGMTPTEFKNGPSSPKMIRPGRTHGGGTPTE